MLTVMKHPAGYDISLCWPFHALCCLAIKYIQFSLLRRVDVLMKLLDHLLNVN